MLTAAGADFEPARDLPGITAFVLPSPATTRFCNDYDEDGSRLQVVSARAWDVDVTPLADGWRDPDALLLGPVAGELSGPIATGFQSQVVGAIAQGWLRSIDPQGNVSQGDWRDAAHDLAGVHVLFLSVHDLPQATARARDFLEQVPMVLLTRGWEGAVLVTRDGMQPIPTLPRQETDPTGAGDVFAAAFLIRYHETGDPIEAGGFAACAASCCVEGIGAAALGDRAEVERRLGLRERLIEEGEWDE